MTAPQDPETSFPGPPRPETPADGPTGSSAAPAEATGGAPEDPLRLVFAVFNEIGIVDQLASTRFTRVLPDGLQLSMFTVLNHFARLGGERTPLELARAFQVSKGTMTHTLQRLEARGLVAIRPHGSDRRSKIVSLTEAGRQTREAAIEALRPEAERLTALIDPQALADLLPGLRRLRETLDRAREGEPPPR
ncbi:MAG: MarR family winged helix-turn-helix transcriptional regulator [Paracoccaceae bacterium]